MKTFNYLLTEAVESSAASVFEVSGVYSDPLDPQRDVSPSFSRCYSLGEQIQRSREGLESNFMSDIIDYDRDPSAYDPYADIRSTYDDRLAYTDKLNAEKKKNHEAQVRDQAGSIAPNGDPVSPASSDSVNQGVTKTD